MTFLESNKVLHAQSKNPTAPAATLSEIRGAESVPPRVPLPSLLPAAGSGSAPSSSPTPSVTAPPESAEALRTRLEHLTQDIDHRATMTAASEARYDAISTLVDKAAPWVFKIVFSLQAAIATFKALNPPVKGPYILNAEPLAASAELCSMIFGVCACSSYLIAQPILKQWQRRLEAQ